MIVISFVDKMMIMLKFMISFRDIGDTEPGTQAHSGECRQSRDGSALPSQSSKPDFFHFGDGDMMVNPVFEFRIHA